MQPSALSMCEINLNSQIRDIGPSEENAVNLLYQIHREINDHSWKELFVEGWSTLKKRNTPAAFTAFKLAGTARCHFSS
ncbi:MAG: hypothetical protein ACI9S8_002879 [Chlamydiales bacterium]|jgi:hypothetical protein